MPNWVRNIIRVSSETKTKREVLNEMIAKKILIEANPSHVPHSWDFDFNALIPMPAALNMNCGSETSMADVIYQVWMNLPKNLANLILNAKDPDELFLADNEGGLIREVQCMKKILDTYKDSITDYHGTLEKLTRNASIARGRMNTGSLWNPNPYNGTDFFEGVQIDDGLEGIYINRIKRQAEDQKLNLRFPFGLFLFLKKSENMKLFDIGATRQENRGEYGAPDWYNWSIKNWGTKWNASETAVDFDEGIISLSTAWSAPIPIYEMLSKEMPDVRFDIIYADEDRGYNCKRLSYKDGAIVEENEPEGGSSEALATYVECWGADSCMYRDAKGNWLKYNCDNCPHPC